MKEIRPPLSAPGLAGVLLIAAAACLGSCTPRVGGNDQPMSLLLVVVDTLRADHLGPWRDAGTGETVTPALDQLADEAIVFDRAFSPAPFTMPAMAATMTGRWPDRVGVVNHDRLTSLPSNYPLLAQLALEAGYRTAAVVTNPWLARRKSGFGRGFEDWYDGEGTGSHPRRGAAAVTRQAEEWLNKNSAEPFLLWTHYMDTHMPYRPDPACKPRPGSSQRSSKVISDFVEGQLQPQEIYFGVQGYAESELEATRLIYDDALYCVDQQLGRLLATLQELEIADSTVVVFMADHGESLGDHGLYFAHDFTLYEELLHVPMMMRVPGRRPGRRPDPVSLVDVLPTLCALMKLDCPQTMDGEDLFGQAPTSDRVLFAAGPPARERYSMNPRHPVAGLAGRWTAATRSSLKLIHLPWPGAARMELYDLERDPMEKENIFGQVDSSLLQEQLRNWRRQGDQQRPAAAQSPLGPDRLRQLRELGYLR
ncbi:MAG: sulfatase [Deltaproteobacteria bacterium]|nr:sulfatase [Deltaproteobacteria bacterium]